MDEGAPALAKARQDHLRMELPPGFRFQPTDEELITHYLAKKVTDASFHAVAIAEVDLNKHEPWDLPLRGKMGEKEWYFFCVRDRKYPTGLRTNRATKAGYWKATGKDTAIYRGKSLVGMKKTLVFYRGRAPKGEKSDWVMHEYRLEGKYSVFNLPPTIAKQNEWVVCRVFHKMAPGFKKPSKEEAPLPPPLMTQANAGNSSSSSNNMASHSTFDSAYVTCFSNAPGTNDDEHFRSPLLFASAEPLLLSVLSSGAVQLPPCASLSMAQRQMSCVSQDSTGLTAAEMNHPEISSPMSIHGRGGGQGLAALAGHSILLPDHSLWNC